MDDDARAELNDLRRRAYGPAAEAPLDHDALRRLVELEELALPGASASLALPDALPTPDAAHPPSVGPARSRWRMPRLHPAATAAIVVISAVLVGGSAVLVGAQPPPSPSLLSGLPGTPARIHLPVQIDDSTGSFEDTAGIDVPTFPLGVQVSWVQSLGTYYGWSVWIGGGTFGGENQNCLLLTDGPATRARCAATAVRVDDGLAISLPYERIGAGDRPQGMTEGQRVDVTWGQGGFVTVARN